MNIKETYKIANDKIEQDYLALKQELYDPMIKR